jgi:deoxyribodipyrimidine photo-lyase
MRSVVWFRGKDLRLDDHLPLHDALGTGEIIPLFVLDPVFFAPERARDTPHRMQFLLESLIELRDDIAARGSRLVLAAGRSVDIVPRLVRQWRADRVVAQRWVAPIGRERDDRIAAQLDVPLTLLGGETLAEPETVRTATGTPYAVFTPFARAFRSTLAVSAPLAAPQALPPLPADVPYPDDPIPSLRDLGIAHNQNLASGGARSGRARLDAFLAGPARRYHELRNRLDADGTSRLSADLKFGTLSPSTVWRAVSAAVSGTARDSFLNELVWREFNHSTLWDRPELMHEPFQPKFTNFPWTFDEGAWSAWTAGRTGYPIVDAASRQVLAEGFVHNRARMIHASFFTKHLLLHYGYGEEHYMRWLADGDWAQNNGGWQWSAGCGCDAQPYFRVFNPVTQGKTYDPDGEYVRRWVPELAALPTAHIHAPWEAPPLVLGAAGVSIGKTYPAPIVDHAEARERFLSVAREYLAGDGAARFEIGRRGRRSRTRV